MIKEISVENVRTFKGRMWNFQLPPLTVFCGTNSAGKSTVLKIPILLRQSQGIDEVSRVSSGKLQLVGSQLDLGDFSSFVSDNDTAQDITISIQAEGRLTRRLLSQLNIDQDNLPYAESSSHLPSSSLEVDIIAGFRFGRLTIAQEIYEPSEQLELELSVSPDKEQSTVPQAQLKATYFDIRIGGKSLVSWHSKFEFSGRTRSVFHYLHLPKYFFDRLTLRAAEPEKSETEGYLKALSPLRGLVHDGLYAPRKRKQDAGLEFWSLPPIVTNVYRQFENILSRIHYLGPLRSPAKRYYMTYLDINRGMDVTGEYLPYIMREMGRSDVLKLRCGMQGPTEFESLGNALNYWLYYLRTGQEIPTYSYGEIRVSTMRDILTEVKIRNVGGTEIHALADSGFGYSQVLPILTQGLLATPGNTLIIEQPELHLNPALQVRLAAFFVAMIRAGKQVLIETHSEHIVNAIRVLTAEDESGELAHQCGIFFIDTGIDNPEVYELSIRPDGTVPDWPPNFFGEALTLSGRLLRAQKKFRKSKE